MYDYIMQCIRDLKPTATFKQVKIDADIKFYQVVFRDVNGKIKTLELLFNEVNIIALKGGNMLLIGSGDRDTIRSKLMEGICEYSSVNEALTNLKFKKPSKRIIEGYMEQLVREMSKGLIGLECGNVKVDKVTGFTYPLLQLIVYYKINDEVMLPMPFALGRCTIPSMNMTDDEKRLINRINNIVGGIKL